MKKLNGFALFVLLNLFSAAVFGQEIKITHGPYLQAVGENVATIVWTTDVDAVSWVELAPSENKSFYAEERPQFYETRNGNRVITRLHKICLTNLDKATEYQYRIFSKEVLKNDGGQIFYGKVVSSNVFLGKPFRFKTLDTGKSEISFSVVNDIHGNSDSLKALLKDVKLGETDLVFLNGDMVSSMLDEKQFFDGFMDASIELFASEVPMCFTRGNHETRGPFSTKFSDYFPTNNGKLYYSFRQGPVYFIVLDGGEDKPDSDIEYSGLAQFDAYRSEQKTWLENIVLTKEFKSAPFRVVVIHIPPMDIDWHGSLDIRKKFLPVLNEAGISVMLCGHTHRYKFIEAKPGELNFPILINSVNTALEVKANDQNMTIQRKNTKGVVLNKHVISLPKM